VNSSLFTPLPETLNNNGHNNSNNNGQFYGGESTYHYYGYDPHRVDYQYQQRPELEEVVEESDGDMDVI
jgi:hypothetical protein